MKYEEKIALQKVGDIKPVAGDLYKWKNPDIAPALDGVCMIIYASLDSKHFLLNLKNPNHCWSYEYAQCQISCGGLIKLNTGTSVTLTQE